MNLRTLYVLSFNDRNVTAAAVILEVTLLKPWSPSDHDKPEVPRYIIWVFRKK